MANIKVRAASLYVKGSKAGEFEGTDYDLQGGDEAQFGEDYLGHSDGIIMTKVTANGVMPVAGTKIDLMGIFLRKEDVSIALNTINGKLHKIDMRLTGCNIKSSHRNGTQQGSFTFEGGRPSVT